MSSAIRSLERGVIKNRCYQLEGNTKSFPDVWEQIHYINKGKVKPKRKIRENLSKQELLMRVHFLRKLQKAKLEAKSDTSNKETTKVED